MRKEFTKDEYEIIKNIEENKYDRRTKHKKLNIRYFVVCLLLIVSIVFSIQSILFEIKLKNEIENIKYEMNIVNARLLYLQNRIDVIEEVCSSNNAKQMSDVTNISDTNVNYIGAGEFKSYMYYTSITCKSSKQYKLQQEAYTDSNGLRKIDDYFIVATGSYFGNVGDILEITLENGNTFLAIKGDEKRDIDTDEENKICVHNGSVVEFIVGKELNKDVKKLGNVSALEFFKGNVKTINVIGSYM